MSIERDFEMVRQCLESYGRPHLCPDALTHIAAEVERLREREQQVLEREYRARGERDAARDENERLRALVREAMGNVSADWFKHARQALEETT